MKKTEIYVLIENKKEAKQAKAVLEALGEATFDSFINNKYYDTGGLYFNTEFREWAIAISFGSAKPNNRKQITLKQLIELLVADKPEKIAIRVDNEKEFNAGDYILVIEGCSGCYGAEGGRGKVLPINSISNAGLTEGDDIDYKIEIDNKIWAVKGKFKKINPPLIKSEDGVWLYEDSNLDIIWKDRSGWEYDNNHKGFKSSDGAWYVNHEINEPQRKLFSTKKAALDWIEAQKPKEIIVSPDSKYPITVYKEPVGGDIILMNMINYSGSLGIAFNIEEIKEIVKAYEKLHSNAR